MGNPLYNLLAGPAQNSRFGNFQQMLQQFQQFKATFQGDPKAEVERLLQSGQINQQQLDQLQDMARQFQQIIK